jgi:hypothetical protein
MPQNLAFGDRATYNTTDLGMVGGAVEAGMLSSGTGSGGISSFIDAMKGSNGKASAKLAAQTVLGVFASDAITGAVKLNNKVTSNPNTRALFNAVPLRTFTFTFKMIPNSRQEAQNVREILAFFRKELYPEKIMFGDTQLSLGYKFPNKFRIRMYYGQGNNKRQVGFKIHDCYLTDISTVFNASSMGMHYDGNFTEVDLSLSFMEAKAISREDIVEEGFEFGALGEDGRSVEA